MHKIAVSTNVAWNIYNFRYNLIKELKKEGYEIVLISTPDKYTEILKKEFEFYPIYIDSKSTNPIKESLIYRSFYKALKETKPDILLTFTIKPNIYGTLAAKKLGIKTINNISGLGSLFLGGSISTKIGKLLYKKALSKTDKVFFQNRDDLELFLKENLVSKEKCDILPGSGVNLEKFKPVKIEKKDNIFRFLLIARMLWDKGIGEYVEAAKILKQKYKNVEFLLLGAIGVDNPTAIPKEKIKEWEEKGLVRYLGTTDNVGQEIAKADCVVLPSYYREGVPRVLLEAAAMEKPIITTNNVGCKETVDNGINGFLCEVKNPKDLADKMEKMLNLSEKERIKMGKAGRKKMEREFDEKIIIRKYLQLIKSF